MSEMGASEAFRPHASSMVERRHISPLASSSLSAPHTPTTTHAKPDPPIHKPSLGARLKAASFSYRSRPRDRSPKILKNETLPKDDTVTNGAPRSFRFRSVTTASFFRSRNKNKQKSLENMEDQTTTTKM